MAVGSACFPQHRHTAPQFSPLRPDLCNADRHPRSRPAPAACTQPGPLRPTPLRKLKLALGCPRVDGRDQAGSSRDARCPRIAPITVGSSILAIILTLPLHCSQVSISLPNTRASCCAQLIARCRSASVLRSVTVGIPRPAGVTSARQRLWGANTRWVVPYRYGVFSVSRTWPWAVRESRPVAIAGWAMYRHSRSTFFLSSAPAGFSRRHLEVLNKRGRYPLNGSVPFIKGRSVRRGFSHRLGSWYRRLVRVPGVADHQPLPVFLL